MKRINFTFAIDLVDDLQSDVLECIKEDMSDAIQHVFNNIVGENVIKNISSQLLTEERE